MKSGISARASWLLLVVSISSACSLNGDDKLLARARANLEAGEYQSALIDARKVVDSRPGNLPAQLLLVDILTSSGDLPSAKVQLDQAVAAGAAPEETTARRLELLLESSDSATARKTLEADRSLGESRRAILEGRLLLLEQRPSEAQAVFERVIAKDPASIEARLGVVEALGNQGNLDSARQAVRLLLESTPASGRGWLLKGQIEARSGDFRQATGDFTRAIEHSRGMTRVQRVRAHVVRLECLLNTGQLDQAKASLQPLEAVASGAPIVSLMRARVALAAGDSKTAVTELRSFTRALPQQVSGRLMMISALMEQGNTEQAFAEAARVRAEFPDLDEPRVALASVQLRMGRIADAEETLQPLLKMTPPNPEATLMLAEVHARSGNVAAGIALLEQASAEQPENTGLKLQLASAYLSSGDAQRAKEVIEGVQDPLYAAERDRLHLITTAALQGPAAVAREVEAVVANHPEAAELMTIAADYAASLGDTDQARAYLQRALRARPLDTLLVHRLARLELSAGRFAEAEALTKSALEKAPNDSTLLVLMANIAAQRGGDADGWLNRARVADPSSLNVSLALARRAALRGNSAEARTILTNLVNAAPGNPAALAALAELVAGQGQSAEALRQLRDAARQHPDSPLIQLATARVQITAKDDVGARASLRNALKLSPGWMPATTLLAGVEVRVGNVPAALAVVREARSVHPADSALDMLEGEILLAGGQPSQAARAFASSYRRKPAAAAAIRALYAKRRAREMNPEAELRDWVERTPVDAGARRLLADYFLASGRREAAIEQLEQVIAARPNDAGALNNLAWLYQEKRDDRAEATARKAYGLAPEAAQVADTLGWILVQNSKVDEGIKVLDRALQLAPGDEGIQQHLAEAKRRK